MARLHASSIEHRRPVSCRARARMQRSEGGARYLSALGNRRWHRRIINVMARRNQRCMHRREARQ